MAVSPIPITTSTNVNSRVIYLFAGNFAGFSSSGLPPHTSIASNDGTLSLEVIDRHGDDMSSLSYLRQVAGNTTFSGAIDGNQFSVAQSAYYRISFSTSALWSPDTTGGSITIAMDTVSLSAANKRPYGWGRAVNNGNAGFDFSTGFSIVTTGATLSIPQSEISPTGATFYAYLPILEDISAVCTFNKNGQGDPVVPPSITVYKGQQFGTLPTPTWTGFTFLGWYTAATGGTKVESTTVVTQEHDFSLFAHWEYDGYKKGLIVLDADGGTCSVGTIEVVPGDAYASLPVPTRVGYTFYGWFTGQGGTGQQVSNGDTVTDPPPDVLFASWIATPPPIGANQLIYDDATGRLIYDDRPVQELH